MGRTGNRGTSWLVTSVVLPPKARGLPRADRDASLRDAPQGEVPLQVSAYEWRAPSYDAGQRPALRQDGRQLHAGPGVGQYLVALAERRGKSHEEGSVGGVAGVAC